ncbi:MAG: hypothetical protein KZQ77_01455 [Candidatus Thiodiazotropha sp. (ex Notomyrtea botanica)]|nr:hypothetical protein [Candidatus Thiodiazotropha sp. (ex Notomyrtea botanica)]
MSEFLSQQCLIETAVDELRNQFPDIHFTHCMDDDVFAASPVHEAESYNLYLIDSRNHCLCFTQELAVATGIVVAELEQA